MATRISKILLKQFKMSTHKSLPTFDMEGPASQVAERWRKWKRAFEYYAVGKGIDDPTKKVSQLLHFAGMEVQDVFEDLQDPGPEEESDNEYSVALRKLDLHFKVEENIPYERHVFRQMAPVEGETADQFVTRLRKQARHCNFGSSLNEQLRDQLIEKLRNLELKRKLLEIRNITLEDALIKSRAWETAQLQATSMAGSAEVNVNTVSRGRHSRGRRCFNCDQEGHFARDRNCPARGKRCAGCGITGHFAVCCRRRGGGSVKSEGDTKSKKTNTRDSNYVGQWEECGEDENSAFAFAITESCNATSFEEPVITVKINGIAKEVLIDSGSVSNLIGMKELEELKAQGLAIKMSNCQKQLFAYGGKKLETIGQFEVILAVSGREVPCSFVVTQQGRCLLGHSTAKALGILSIGPGANINSECNVVHNDLKSQMLAKYPGVFKGVGKLRDYQLRLHTDPNVVPLAQKPRRIPFALRDKVSAKIAELIDLDIVEKVNGPTSWTSPVVVAPKASGDIRLCVDMRRANAAIIRERIPVPTVDDISETLPYIHHNTYLIEPLSHHPHLTEPLFLSHLFLV